MLRLGRYLQAHPILCLLLLTPGIPEYLSGSSPLSSIFYNPAFFVLQIALNAGLYTAGVLLIREAMVRWHKGFGSVLLLGAAYGVLEEGIALSTMFNSYAGPVGSLGFYGHWLGVNWVWAVGLDIFHAVFSVAVPILLLGLALPQTRGVRLLTRRQMGYVVAILVADVLGLMLLIGLAEHFWASPYLLAGALLYIGSFVAMAYRAPSGLLRPWSEAPAWSARGMGLLGLSFFPAMLLVESIPEAAHVPAAATALAAALLGGAFLFTVLAKVGRSGNRAHVAAFAMGLIVPVAALGFLSQVGTGIGLSAVVAGLVVAFLFFRWVWRRESAIEPARVPVPLALAPTGAEAGRPTPAVPAAATTAATGGG